MSEQREIQLKQFSPAIRSVSTQKTKLQVADEGEELVLDVSPVNGKSDDFNTIRSEINGLVLEEYDSLSLTVAEVSLSKGQVTCLGIKRYGQRCNITQVGPDGYCLFHRPRARETLTQTLELSPVLGDDDDVRPSDDPEADTETLYHPVVHSEEEKFQDQNTQALKAEPPRQVPQYLFALPHIYSHLEV
jgi:hypothetical protein